MQNLIVKYPLDLRGNSAVNRVQKERHELPANGNRVIVPIYGPFYTAGLIVREYSTGRVLERNVQWKAVQLYQEAVQRTGKEVCAVIVIVDNSVGNLIEIDYQVVGGKFSRAVPVIKQLIEDLEIDERAVQWGDLLAVPEAFPPVSHLHDAGDLYGFEYVVAALEEVHKAILIGDAAAHEEIVRYIEEQAEVALLGRQELQANLDDHKGDDTNPHGVTKDQVGLGNLSNYSIATTEEAQEGSVSNRYMTPQRVKEAIDAIAGDALNAHIDNHKNPHQVTKAQVGLEDVPNWKPGNIEHTTPEASGGATYPNYDQLPDDNFVTTRMLMAALHRHSKEDVGSHDARYVTRGEVEMDGNIQVSQGRAYVAIDGKWRQIWPAQWA